MEEEEKEGAVASGRESDAGEQNNNYVSSLR